MNNTVKREIINLSNKPTLIISEKLHSQINTLHGSVGKLEWSGILFLKKLEGDISTPSELVYKAETMMLCDIGRETFTSYEFSEEVFNFYQKCEEDIPDIEDYKIGLIHSHQNLGFTTFSSTDISELQDNAPNHNYYISLIVDFTSRYSAKVAFVAKKEANLRFIGSEGETEEISLVEQEVLVTLDFDIVMSTDKYLLSSITKCKGIQKTREEEAKKIKPIVKVDNLLPKSPVKPVYNNSKYYNSTEDDFYDNYVNKSNFDPFKIEDKLVEDFLSKIISLNPLHNQSLDVTLKKLYSIKKEDKAKYSLCITDDIIYSSYKAIDEINEYSMYEFLDLAVCKLDDLQVDNPTEAQILEDIIKVLESCYEVK